MSTAVLAPVTVHVSSRRASPWRWDLAAVGLVVAAQLVYFTGVVASDDFSYLDAAWHAGAGQPMPDGAGHILARFVLWRPIQLAVAIFPNQPWAMALPSMLASLAILLTLRAFARRYLDPRTAPLAVLIYGLIPVNVALASVALPEPTATALGWLGICLSAAALLDRDTHRAEWRCLVAGLMIGAGYNAKETVAVLVPSLLLFVLVCRTRCRWAWWRAALLAAGMGMWIAGETLAMGWLYGDPWFHARAVADVYRNFGPPPIALNASGLLSYTTEYVRWLADPRGDFAPMGLLLVAGVGYAVLRRTPVSNLLLCLTLPGLVYLSVGSSQLGQYLPLVHQPRYLVPILPGLALLAAMMVGWLWQLGPRGRQVAMLAGVVVIAAALASPNRFGGRWHNASTFAAGYQLVEERFAADQSGPRLCAAGLSRNQFGLLPRWLACPEIELVHPIPASAAQWVERYGGAYVITTRFDRVCPSRERHWDLSLYGPGYDALAGFELVARKEPPRDRLSTLFARLLGRPIPTDPTWAVELRRVPTLREWEAGRPWGSQDRGNLLPLPSTGAGLRQ